MSAKKLLVLLVAPAMVAAFLVAACGDDESDPNLNTGDDDDNDDDNDDAGGDDDTSPDPLDDTCVAAYNQIYTECEMSFPGYTLEEMIAGNCNGGTDPIFGVDGAIVQCYLADPTCEPLIACISVLFE